MAGLKKKKKEPSTSPNLALVIFLVFFVILSIVLGVFVYYGFEEKEEAKTKAKLATDTLAPEKQKVAYYAMLYGDLRTAIGDKLEKEEQDELSNYMTDYLKEDFGKFKILKDKETTRKLMEELKKELGLANNTYESNYKQKLKVSAEKIAELDGKANGLAADLEKNKELLKELTTNQDNHHKKALARIDKDNTNAMNMANQKSDSFQKTAEANRALTKELEKAQAQIEEAKEEHKEIVRKLELKIQKIDEDRKQLQGIAAGPGGGQANLARLSGDHFPLILDISPGKPLWDNPVGKVIRVDLETRQVAINLGSSHGIRPEVTFNIFGANTTGRAEKQMKGTIEVVKVLDSSSSLCRITSLYDLDGREILLNLDTRTRLQRETEAAIREGDLLYNLFWGTRVAVTGYVSLTSDPSSNPAEQIRQMEDFMYLLARNGVQVDAFVDPRDGQIRGNITHRTRYLIRGDTLIEETKKRANAPAKEGDDKEPAKDMGINKERYDAINKSSQVLFGEAKEKGMLMISVENFANVIGYRKARNAFSVETSSFRPSLPYAGAPDAGVLRAPPAVQPMPPMPKEEEKKGEDKKDMEKKEAN